MSSNTKYQTHTILQNSTDAVYADVARFGRIMVQFISEAAVDGITLSGAFMPAGSVQKDPAWAFPITPESVYEGTVQSKGGTTLNVRVVKVDMPLRTLMFIPGAASPKSVQINMYMDRFDLHGVD